MWQGGVKEGPQRSASLCLFLPKDGLLLRCSEGFARPGGLGEDRVRAQNVSDSLIQRSWGLRSISGEVSAEKFLVMPMTNDNEAVVN